MVLFRVNTFTIEDEEDLTTLSKIEVMRDNTGNDWYLEDVSFNLHLTIFREFTRVQYLRNTNSVTVFGQRDRNTRDDCERFPTTYKGQ